MMVSVAFAEDALTAPEHMSGGWIASTDPTMTDELKALFEAGTETLTGMDYEPVAILVRRLLREPITLP